MSDMLTRNVEATPGRRVGVVTGAGGGIGRAIALRLAADGTAVAVVDTDASAASATVDIVERNGGTALAVEADLALPELLESVADQTHRNLGGVGVLVNNVADHGERCAFAQVGRGAWDRILATNVTAAAFLAQVFTDDLAAHGGVIVNLLAIQEDLPAPTYVPYVTSKGALSALTRALAVELAPKGIRVCGVAPGMIDTASTAGALAAASAGTVGAPTLIGRMGLPAEVASAVAYLVSQEAAFVTGATIRVDGGRLISRRPDPLSGLEAQTVGGVER